jgi:alanyl-tRNA synthetase
MGDQGSLEYATGRLRIVDVQIENGLVHHIVEGPFEVRVGEPVQGRIDEARRRLHMALHTGQHMLSAALATHATAETVSSRLGESGCTLDVDRDGLTARSLEECETLVNSIIDEDRAVRAFFPNAEELAEMRLRRAPKNEGAVRVVVVPGFDITPCGGTHVLHTSQIGLLRVEGFERYKGGTRIHFSAGSRARRMLFGHDAQLRELARRLETAPLSVPEALTRLQGASQELRTELGKQAAMMASLLAEQVRIAQPGLIRIHAMREGGKDLARLVTDQLCKDAQTLNVVVASVGESAHVVIARGPESTHDCKALFQELAKRTGGRGGGRPERAEGTAPSVDAALAEVREMVTREG